MLEARARTEFASCAEQAVHSCMEMAMKRRIIGLPSHARTSTASPQMISSAIGVSLPGVPAQDVSIPATKDAVLDLQGRLTQARSDGYTSLRALPPDLLAEIRALISAVVSEASSALLTAPSKTEDDQPAAVFADRAKWADRDETLQQSPREFFLTHYPDWQTGGLTGPLLRQLDPVLYSRLATHGNRYPLERIRLPSKAHAAFAQYSKLLTADSTLSIEDMERMVRAVGRKGRKRRL